MTTTPTTPTTPTTSIDYAAYPPYPSDGEMSQPSGVNVRAEEIGLVLLALILWAGAVALFFNRWGKIRMLEPYQPKFIDTPARTSVVNGGISLSTTGHRPSYPLVEFNQSRGHHSRQNMASWDRHCSDAFGSSSGRRRAPSMWTSGGSSAGSSFFQISGELATPTRSSRRPRQNSVVVYATAHFLTSARRVKSAVDLQTLVLREETEENVHNATSAASATSATSDTSAASATAAHLHAITSV